MFSWLRFRGLLKCLTLIPNLSKLPYRKPIQQQPFNNYSSILRIHHFAENMKIRNFHKITCQPMSSNKSQWNPETKKDVEKTLEILLVNQGRFRIVPAFRIEWFSLCCWRGSTYLKGSTYLAKCFTEHLLFTKCFEMFELFLIFNVFGGNICRYFGILVFLVNMFEDDMFAIWAFEHFL